MFHRETKKKKEWFIHSGAKGVCGIYHQIIIIYIHGDPLFHNHFPSPVLPKLQSDTLFYLT